MREGRLLVLLLLAVSVFVARCQQTPQVSTLPKLPIFSGDIIYLSCTTSSNVNSVKWYFNSEIKSTQTNKTWKLEGAAPMHSGSYQCESNGKRSDPLNISVLAYLPRASLSIKTGQPVMRPGGSVILQLDNDNGLLGWKCWVLREDVMKRIKLKLENDSVTLAFQTRELQDLETIYWCTDRTQDYRSNQIIVRTSEKDVALEMYPLPALTGESLTLRCLVWGTNQITHTVFYKDNAVIVKGSNPTHKIPHVTESVRGKYKCDATFTHHSAHTDVDPYHVASDEQDVFVKGPLVKAVLTENVGLSCSCPLCPSEVSYHWNYKIDDGQPWELTKSNQDFIMPKERGTYSCYAAWDKGRSFLSSSHVYKPPIKVILILLIIVLVTLCFTAAAIYFFYKRRNSSGPIYEDVALRSVDKGDDKYEKLQRTQREGEYDTIHPEAAGQQRKEGEYQHLKKEEMREGEYHTLGIEGAGGGAGGYEALKKQGITEGVYHTLGMEGAGGGAGGYEALKKQGITEGVYHTLGMEGAGGGAGGYEALKKQGITEGVYHTLGMEGAAGGAGGYEALKKEGMAEGVYHTLGMEGAGGGVVETD